MNPSLHRLLTFIADGKTHSGESLGEALGVSRAAVWKQLQQLQELGVPLTSVKGSGYCVEGGLDLLDRSTILDGLAQKAPNLKLKELQVETALDSTSQQLIQMSAQGQSIHALACFAEKQFAGRGRRGRSWQSPFAQNLYFSIGWRIQNGVAAVEGLSLAVGVAIAEALEQSGFNGVVLKWPNDLLFQHKKLGGILLEINGDAAGECDLVLGVGLNVAMPLNAGEAIDQPWTDLSAIASENGVVLPGRNELAAQLLASLLALLNDYETKGFAHWRERWQLRDANAGREVELILGAQSVRGRVKGVSRAGALILQTPAGEQTFIGGEISLRSLG